MTEASDCPHYELLPPDLEGQQLCTACGRVVQLGIAGLPLVEYELQSSTVLAREGDDVVLPDR